MVNRNQESEMNTWRPPPATLTGSRYVISDIRHSRLRILPHLTSSAAVQSTSYLLMRWPCNVYSQHQLWRADVFQLKQIHLESIWNAHFKDRFYTAVHSDQMICVFGRTHDPLNFSSFLVYYSSSPRTHCISSSKSCCTNLTMVTMSFT